MELDCPRCTIGKLEEVEIDEVLIDRCLVCGGLWFDQGELTQMVGDDNAVKEIEAAIPSEKSDILCPRCIDTTLRKQEVCELQGKSIDIFRCPSCLGTWMDRGVLRRSEDQHIAQNAKHCFTDFLKK